MRRDEATAIYAHIRDMHTACRSLEERLYTLGNELMATVYATPSVNELNRKAEICSDVAERLFPNAKPDGLANEVVASWLMHLPEEVLLSFQTMVKERTL